ncbi:MAG: HAD family phosphatase [Candidatus Sungbacteria bacterium]|uniref:phosphoserine phosphatase n=1 Tax=Candidatus Sungiibacteriota bacterium TaxID=2750080 RepID=A0A9D6LQN7_9BACT|nr:HAD family phosphatase [Candidatus Sungbacteria bacterium]
MAKPPLQVAVFDIDGTIFRSSLLIELVEALIQEGIFPPGAKRSYSDAYNRWIAREGNVKTGFSYYEYISKVVSAYEHHIRGVRRADVWKVAAKVLAFHRVRLYRYTRDLVQKLRRTHFLLAISHSPYEIVAPFAKSLHFDKTYSMVYEVDSQVRFTGKVLYEATILNKAETLRRAMKKNNLTLKNSVGVGDTESDIPFLKMVDRPVVFNPSMKLFRYARAHNWEVVVERKDVIYRFGQAKSQRLISNF